MLEEPAMPTPVSVPLSEPVRKLWFQKMVQTLGERYMGISMLKLPEDLRVYEYLLWTSRANVVIELGSNMGGSALWFRDRLAALAAYGRIERPMVITVDQRTPRVEASLDSVDSNWRDSISVVGGDVTDPGLVEEVRRLLPPDARCLVSEDTAHTYETTIAALRGFSQFVPVGGFFVAEDGSVDVEEMRPPRWTHRPRGVIPAVRDWLAEEGKGFQVRRDLELYGLTSNVEGYLERIA
jgi:cephalosporin hydroxylase